MRKEKKILAGRFWISTKPEIVNFAHPRPSLGKGSFSPIETFHTTRAKCHPNILGMLNHKKKKGQAGKPEPEMNQEKLRSLD